MIGLIRLDWLIEFVGLVGLIELAWLTGVLSGGQVSGDAQ